MIITHLSLTNFRNYGRLELDLPPGPTLLHGGNAQGKTNLLEAIYYLATTRSPHAAADSQLINWDAQQTDEPIIVGRLVAQVETERERRLLEMRLIQEKNRQLRNGRYSFRREALVDKRKVRLMDLLGNLRVVLFLPEDVQLITGPPNNRRRYLNITLCQIDSIYCRTLSAYNKVLEQRNALLRQLAEGEGSREMLTIFTEKLVSLGSQIFARRAVFLTNLAREAQRLHYEELTNGGETIRLQYAPRLEEVTTKQNWQTTDLTAVGEWLRTHHEDTAQIEARFAAALEQMTATEIARGMTVVGPHRDDWSFLLNGRFLSSFGSRGQQRSAILALKLAEINWMKQQTGETPVLLLDEVVAEFDEQRRSALLKTVSQATQAVLTATDPGMFTSKFLRQATPMLVADGQIQAEQVIA